MKKTTAAVALMFAVSLAAFSIAESNSAQAASNTPPFRAHGINRPFDYRFPVTPRNYSVANRYHRYGWRHHRRFQPLPALAGPMVIYQNGEIGIPPHEEFTGSIPNAPISAQPVVHRVGETGACDVQQVNVPGSLGRTTINIWRC
jgi:hypothetical protein